LISCVPGYNVLFYACWRLADRRHPDLPDAALGDPGALRKIGPSSIWLLRVICNTKLEYPRGAGFRKVR